MRVIQSIDQAYWEEISRVCSYATLFHTHYWSKIMSDTFGYDDITKGFIFDDGTRAVFPLMKRNVSCLGGLLKYYVSGPPYTYGGPIADGKIGQDKYSEMLDYILSIASNSNRLLIRGNPYNEPFSTKGFSKVDDHSHIIEIKKIKSEQDFFNLYGKRYRRYIRKALNNDNLMIKEANSYEEFDNLYKLYQKSIRYWEADLTRYPIKLFENLYKLRGKFIKLWVVYNGDQMIGGDVTLNWANKCHMILSYHDREYSKIHHRRYLLHKLFLHSKENKITHYDLMQSGGIKSQEAFKESMGGVIYQHSAYVKDHPIIKISKQFRNTITNVAKYPSLRRLVPKFE